MTSILRKKRCGCGSRLEGFEGYPVIFVDHNDSFTEFNVYNEKICGECYTPLIIHDITVKMIGEEANASME
jgi:hypothetical protein